MPKKRALKKCKLKPNLHIFCEGEKTEPNYLRGYIDAMFPGTRLSPIRKTAKNTPVQLVEVAIKAQDDNPPDDVFWVVYDRESVAKYPEKLHAEAYSKARKFGIQVALSNVCFEVWILLHFQKTVAAYDNYDDLRKHSKLCEHIRDYDKGAKTHFSEEEIDLARKNAEKMNANTISGANLEWTEPYQWNPYTDVYKLLDAIDAFLSVAE
jgi:hypothetical protein